MEFGFIKVAAATPSVKVADVEYNTQEIIKCILEADKQKAEVIVFPELCVTGYTCGDLFFYDTLIKATYKGVEKIINTTKDINSLIFIGIPFKYNDRIYNVALAIYKGKILGIVPKTYLPNYNEFNEKRYFVPAAKENLTVNFLGQETIFGKKVIFDGGGNFKVSAEICEDLWSVTPPSINHALAGATIIVNLSCSTETVGKLNSRKNLVSSHCKKIVAGYVYANCGKGESTTDCVYSGHNIIAEHGKILCESTLFENQIIYSEIDTDSLAYERSKLFNYDYNIESGYQTICFPFERREYTLTRRYSKTPFVPKNDLISSRAELVLSIQAAGLEKRLVHTGAKKLVIGLSGGLDSTLAILVCAKVMQNLKRDTKDILAVTMPCFGTSERTLTNTIKLAKALKVTLKKIDITKTVTRHLKDISHPLDLYDAAYENAQARERTQVIMDLANAENGLVVGTGDLSELALGWATYNGDHMSMYGVNGSIPKTLVRYLVSHVASISKLKLKTTLQSILDTPVSPELLPAESGEISQKTEEIVGPYILHDFFLYNLIRKGFGPKKVFYLACKTFEGDFKKETILKWLTTFVKRFFSQQFKRSCLPDGVKVGSVGFSPRGDWHMPSDAICSAWLEELKNL